MVADEEAVEEDLGGEEEVNEEAMEVSLCSVVELTNPKTMKLKGEIQGCEVVVMINPRATHNFLSLRVIEEARVTVKDGGEFEVSLGNGESVRGHGVCKGVRVKLAEGITMVEEFLPLGLGSANVILGVQWLENLGPITTNWKTHVMHFSTSGVPVTLVVDPTLVKTQISLKAMIRNLQKTERDCL